MRRRRLDEELVSQGFFMSVEDARRSVMAGEVSGPSMRYDAPGTQVRPGCALHVRGRRPYVSRGGLKLAGALDELGVDVAGLACLDVGCSTGGFSDCLLKRGAASVLAVDVGYAQFDWSLRQDSRVELLERTNVCDLPLARASTVASIDFAVCDVSFTSVLTVLPSVCALLRPHGRFLALVKPQFEAGREDVGPGGVVVSDEVRGACVAKVAAGFEAAGLAVLGSCESPITGTKGNREYFVLGER